MTRTLEMLDRLIAFATVSAESNLDLIAWVESLLPGARLTRFPSPCRQKAGLHVRIGPDAPGGIVLSGHTDVVPVEGQDWTRDAFRMTQDAARVYGRGVTDMKGFLASALAAAERAKALTRPLDLVLSYDEEVGCIGIQQMLPVLEPLLEDPALVVVGEPTGMQVATGHKGKAALRVTCCGEAGHSALAPRFLNAIHVAARVVDELRRLQAEMETDTRDMAYDVPFTTVHVGRINGGRALNIVPDTVVLEMEYRHLAAHTPAQMRARIDALAQRVAAEFGTPELVTVEEVFSYPGLEAAPSPLTAQISGDAPVTKVAFGTEAGVFAALGLPAIVIGPGQMARDGHKPDEGLDRAELAACDGMMDRVLAQLSG